MSRIIKRIIWAIVAVLVLYWISTLSSRFQLDFLILFLVFLGLAGWAWSINQRHRGVLRKELETHENALAISPAKSSAVEMMTLKNGAVSVFKVQARKILPLAPWTEKPAQTLRFKIVTVDRGLFRRARRGIRMSEKNNSSMQYDFVVVDTKIGTTLSVLDGTALDNVIERLNAFAKS